MAVAIAFLVFANIADAAVPVVPADSIKVARGEAFHAWALDILSKGIRYSSEMPFVTVTRHTSYDYISMTVSFDPTPYGIAKSRRSQRKFKWRRDAGTQSLESLTTQLALAYSPT